MNEVRKCIIKSLYKTIPHTRILVSLSIIEDIILKIHDNEIENIVKNILDSRENVLYMLSFEQLVNDEQETIKTGFYGNSSESDNFFKEN